MKSPLRLHPVAGRNYLPPLADGRIAPPRRPLATMIFALAAVLLAIAAGGGMALVLNG